MLLLLWPVTGRGDAFDAYTDQGIAHYQAQRYEESIRAFQAAYALRQWPRLLLNIGQAHLRLGHAREALRYYEAYLRARPTPEPEIRAELERAMAQARALLAAAGPDPAQAGADPTPAAAREADGASPALPASSASAQAPHLAPGALPSGRTSLGAPGSLPSGRTTLGVPGALPSGRTSLAAPGALPSARTSLAPEQRRPVWRKWWLWTAVTLGAGAVAAGTAVLLTRPWEAAAWRDVPPDNRREVDF